MSITKKRQARCYAHGCPSFLCGVHVVVAGWCDRVGQPTVRLERPDFNDTHQAHHGHASPAYASHEAS